MYKSLPSTRTPDWDEELVARLTRSLSKGTVKYRSLNLKKRNAVFSTGGWIWFIAFWDLSIILAVVALQPVWCTAKHYSNLEIGPSVSHTLVDKFKRLLAGWSDANAGNH